MDLAEIAEYFVYTFCIILYNSVDATYERLTRGVLPAEALSLHQNNTKWC